MSQTAASERWITDSFQLLRSRARYQLARFPGIKSMQPTDVVSEVILKMARSGLLEAEVDRMDFMRAFSRAARDILIDRLRRKSAQKRGGSYWSRSLSADLCGRETEVEWQLDIQQAIETLRQEYPRQADVVEMKFHGRFSTKEIAGVLRVSISTVEEDWRKAKGRLLAILHAYKW